MSSKKPDEYTAAIREADAARKQISALETQILEQMETLEKAEASLNERSEEISSLNSDREARLKEFDDETREQSNRLTSNRAERERLVAALPKPMGALYVRISARIRDGVAVAEARNGACMACFMALRPQAWPFTRDEVITCDNCNRILYSLLRFSRDHLVRRSATGPHVTQTVSLRHSQSRTSFKFSHTISNRRKLPVCFTEA